MKHRFDHKKFRVSSDDKIKLRKVNTKAGKEFAKKENAAEALASDIAALQEMQGQLYASNTHALLVILQGMDASGKDGMIRHVMKGINPQGCQVASFNAPSSEELEHHFLWRPMRYLPKRGMISLFNRSYYEEVIVVRVHPEFLEPQRLPKFKKLGDLWQQRFEEISHFEDMLVRHGTAVVKFFLHVSRDEQKSRLLERMKYPEKNWKFSERDLEERKLWDKYEQAFEELMPATSTKGAPWYIIPADDKWYARSLVADIIVTHMEGLGLAYPVVTEETRQHYQKLALQLEQEG